MDHLVGWKEKYERKKSLKFELNRKQKKEKKILQVNYSFYFFSFLSNQTKKKYFVNLFSFLFIFSFYFFSYQTNHKV